jgi:hypothetical protein
MWASPAEYLRLDLRVHELLRDVPLYDVSVVDLPGGGDVPREALSETRNATVHGFLSTALARTASGYRLYWGIYVIPVSWLTRPYLMAIEPFRRILYPAMLRRIRRAWLAAYGTTA